MTWTPASKQSETWAPAHRHPVFDRNVFDNDPTFDTGGGVQLWVPKSEQVETWVVKP